MSRSDCTISGNTTAGIGGGLRTQYGTMSLSDCTVSGNTAGSWGGGIYSTYATTTVVGCTVSGNTSAGSGGGVANDASTFAAGLSGTIDLAPYYGAIVIADPTGSVTIDGGGVVTLDVQGASGVVQVAPGTTATLENLTITGGSATSGGGVVDHGNLTMKDCSLTGNTASYNGGAIYAEGAGELTIDGCTIERNSAGDGGGIVIYNVANASMRDDAIEGNAHRHAGDRQPEGQHRRDRHLDTDASADRSRRNRRRASAPRNQRASTLGTNTPRHVSICVGAASDCV